LDRDILALAASIVLIVVLVRFRVDLGIAMLAGACTMALGAGFAPKWTAVHIWLSAIQKDTLLLFGRIAAILALGALAGTLGYLDHLVSGLKKMIRDNRVVVALIPAFGGLLPMPGGTMLTAPMVGSALKDDDVSPEQLLFISYWFRHVWEYVWPLYPGVVFTATVIGRPVADIFQANWPLTVAAIAGGAFFVLRHVRAGRNETSREMKRRGWPELVKGVLPFAIVITGALVLKIELILVVLAVIVLLAVFERARPRDVGRAFRCGVEFQIITLVFGVAAYKDLLIATGIRESVPAFLVQMQMPELVVIIAVPMLIGLVTGVTMAFIAVTFPLLIPIFGSSQPDMHLVMLAFASGFVGCLISPVHLCLVLARAHFNASFARFYRMMALPIVVIMAVAIGIVLL
jgi:integral membrane protein (TIGR00529 family)